MRYSLLLVHLVRWIVKNRNAELVVMSLKNENLGMVKVLIRWKDSNKEFTLIEEVDRDDNWENFIVSNSENILAIKILVNLDDDKAKIIRNKFNKFMYENRLNVGGLYREVYRDMSIFRPENESIWYESDGDWDYDIFNNDSNSNDDSDYDDYYDSDGNVRDYDYTPNEM